MNALKVFKGAADIIVSIGAGAIVTNAIKATSPEDMKLVKKLSVAVGGFVISSMVADAASKYTSEKIDEGVQAVKDAKNANQSTDSE